MVITKRDNKNRTKILNSLYYYIEIAEKLGVKKKSLEKVNKKLEILLGLYNKQEN